MEVKKNIGNDGHPVLQCKWQFWYKKGLVFVRPEIGQSGHDRIEAELAGLGLIVLLADVYWS